MLARSASYHCVDLVAYEGYPRFAMRVALEPVPALVSLSVPTGSGPASWRDQRAWQSWPITTLDERIAQDRAYYALVERAERESAARRRRSWLGFLTSVGLGGLALYALARDLGVSAHWSAVGLAAYLFHPLVLSLAYTFMTDPHYVSLMLIATWLYVRGLLTSFRFPVDRRRRLYRLDAAHR